MKLIATDIPGVMIIEPTLFTDERGWFMESFNEQNFQQRMVEHGLIRPLSFVQDNHSCSHKGVLRGLHFQASPFAQGKLVRVTNGAALDVAVDIRPSSVTFGKHVMVELNSQNHRMLWIPEGFAHGFLALEDNTHFLYKTTRYYHRSSELAIAWNDPAIGIQWPQMDYVISDKDQNAPLLQEHSLGER